MATRVFNFKAFYNDLNKKRKARGIAWNKVAIRAGLAPSGLSLFVRQFENPDSTVTKVLSVENLAKLLDWMGQTDLAPYLVDEDNPDVTP